MRYLPCVILGHQCRESETKFYFVVVVFCFVFDRVSYSTGWSQIRNTVEEDPEHVVFLTPPFLRAGVIHMCAVDPSLMRWRVSCFVYRRQAVCHPRYMPNSFAGGSAIIVNAPWGIDRGAPWGRELHSRCICPGWTTLSSYQSVLIYLEKQLHQGKGESVIFTTLKL